MDRKRILQVFFFGLLILFAYELYVLLSPFLAAIGWAILFAFVAHPVLGQVQRWVRSRTLAAAVVTSAVALGVILPAFWLSGRLAVEVQNLYTSATASVGGDGIAFARDWAARSPLIASITDTLARFDVQLADEIPKLAVQAAQFTSDYVVSNVTAVARNVLSLVISFTIVLFTLFYLLRDGERYYETLRGLTPLEEHDKEIVFEGLRSALSAVMRGLLLTSVMQGAAIGIGLYVCGVPYSLFLTLLTAICSLLPLVGTALVWVPAAIWLLYTSGWGWAIVLVAWSSLWAALIDNFIRPMMMKEGTGLPTMAVFFGMMGGLEAWGFIGMFAGPAVIAIFAALLGIYRRTYGDGDGAA
ncbi:MAG: AI-2E family transporter [Candidatus Binataceae bacterium]